MRQPKGVLNRVLAVGAAIAALAASQGCAPRDDTATAGHSAAARAEAPAERRDGPDFNVFVLVLDSCRADKIATYGYDRPTMPAFDALARDPDAVVFHRHYAQAPATKGSTASLFTGLLVRQHGISGGVQVDKGSAAFRVEVLDSNFPLLAEYFRQTGAFTVAGVKSYHLIPEYGFARGFDLYISPKNFHAADPFLTELARGLILGARNRFFAYFHLNACHNPFEAGLRDPEYMASYPVEYDEAARQTLGIDFQTAAIKAVSDRGELRLEADDVRFLNLVYEAKMRTTDRGYLRPILAAFAEAGIYDDTLIIVTADHGEELYEHGGYAHGHALWHEITRVPLVVKFPKGRRPAALGSAVHEPTRTIDITASLIRIAGGEPPPGATGVAILEGELPSHVVSERRDNGWAVAHDGYRLIHAHDATTLFRLADDIAEMRDLAAAEPVHVEQLTDFVQKHLSELSAAGARADVIEKPVDAKEVEALRALGYIE